MANNLNVNPILINAGMSVDYLTAIGAAAGLERPLRITKLAISCGQNVQPGTLVIGDGSNATFGSQPVLLTMQLPATNTTMFIDFASPLIWRNFQINAVGTNISYDIWRR